MKVAAKLKLNRFVFYFQYFPSKKPRKYPSIFTGFLGALAGLYIWMEYLGEGFAEWNGIIFLLVPSLLAFMSFLFNKRLLMYLAFLVSLAVILSVSMNFLFIYFPPLCYLMSILLRGTKSLTKEEKGELEKLITEQARKVEQETKEQIKKAQMMNEDDPLCLTAPKIAAIYQINLLAAHQIKDNFESYRGLKGSPFANTYRLGIFYVLARTNGIWDLKQTLGEKNIYQFNGTQKTGEYIGNHHYGYMGKAIGLSSTVLRLAAGIYQIYSGTSKWKFAFTYFDDPLDSKAISDGCKDEDAGSLSAFSIKRD